MREILQQALDALIYADNELCSPVDDTTPIRQAIQSIRLELAKPVPCDCITPAYCNLNDVCSKTLKK